MNIPLVSEYKVPFIRHRVLQTFLGGFELLPAACSQQYLLRLAIFLCPGTLGILSSMLMHRQLVDPYIAVLLVSILNFLFVLSLHLVAFVQRESAKVSPLSDEKPNPNRIALHQLIPVGVHHSILVVLLYSSMASALIGLMTHLFPPNLLSNQGLGYTLFVVCWFTFAVSHYSLTMGPAPETAAYSMTFNTVDSFNRPVHLLLCLGLLAVIPSEWGPYHMALLLLISLLPFLWLLGIMPPVQSLADQFLEQVNVLLGGTSSTSTCTLLTAVLATSSSVVMAHFLLHGVNFLLACSLVAFLASNKWLTNWSQTWTILHLSKTLMLLSVIAAIFYLPEELTRVTGDTASTTLIALVISISVAKHSQRIYLLNLFKNPVYLFQLNDYLRIAQVERVLIWVTRICIYLVLPLVSLITVRSRIPVQALSSTLGRASVSAILRNILVFRMFRQLWQYPLRFAIQLVAIPMLDLWLVGHWLTQWPVECKHFALGLVLTISVDFVHKLYLVLVILWASVFLKKQRLSRSWTLFVINLIIWPYNLLLITISSILKAPILPLFTLPIYMLSFPRPLKFWSTTPTSVKSNINDAAYYQQILPRLVQALQEQKLFWDFCRAGEFLLARYEDRLMWIQVLETGYDYVIIQMKGLELQETSCHAIEASAIDHIIEMAERGTCFNSHFLFTISPITRTSVRTYSDAKNVLTGIIDSPETYERIKNLFCQVLVWVLLQKRIQANKQEFSVQMSSALKKTNLAVKLESAKKKNTVSDVESNSKTSLGSFHYESLLPNMQWSNASFEYSKQNPNQNQLSYSLEWFREILKEHIDSQYEINLGQLQSLSLMYRNIANVCHFLVFPPAYTEVPTSQIICQIFNGEIANEDVDNKFFESNPDLHEACIKSFQYSTKIAFDQVIFANDKLSVTEMILVLLDFDQNWHFGNRTLPQWKESVLMEKGNLFGIGKDMVKENYTSHLLTLRDMDVHVCSLNRATIEAIWSTLSLELFYLTNDDEERYSIQAHHIILRNLTVQAADPPLGYPIFASEPTVINHLFVG